MKILMTGVSGLIGKALSQALFKQGHEIIALVRSPEKISFLPEQNVVKWSSSKDIPQNVMSGVQGIINLAGENVAQGRWTEERKQKLVQSRCETTRKLVKAVERMAPGSKPQVFVSTSAIGFYGNTGENKVDEDSAQGSGFLADLCLAWEKEALQASSYGVRVVIGRLGVVLAREGGALEKMGPAVLGSGQQWMSWVHIEDVVRFFQNAVENTSFSGIYNVTSPHPIRNKEFTQIFAKHFKYPLVLPVPSFLLKAALGQMASVLLDSQAVIPKRTLAHGFQFKFDRLKQALEDLFGETSFLDNRFSASQFLPLTQEAVFPFFSKAENLETLTPPWLNFRITKKSTETIQKGSVIDYQLKIRGVPVKWRTLISQWEPNQSFVDDQIRGPYKKWHHVHSFETVAGGTLLKDEVTFQVPGSVFGKTFLTYWIKKDVEKIFSYRKTRIQELYRKNEFSKVS